MRLPPWTWKLLRSRRVRIAAGCSSSALLLAAGLSYPLVNYQASEAERKQLEHLKDLGFETNWEIYFHADADPRTDLIQRLAALTGPGAVRITPMDRLPGVASPQPSTVRALAEPLDLTQWFRPAAASEREAAERLLALQSGATEVWGNTRVALDSTDAAWPARTWREIGPATLAVNALGRYAKIHAIAEMAAGDPAEALADVEAMIRVEWHILNSRPCLVSSFSLPSAQSNLSDVVWEGMHRGVWDEPALAAIESRLSGLEPQQGGILALRGELALTGAFLAEPDNLEAPSLADVEWKRLWGSDAKDTLSRIGGLWLAVRPAGVARLKRVEMREEYVTCGCMDGAQPRRFFHAADLKSFREKEAALSGIELPIKGGLVSGRDDVAWRYLISVAENAMTTDAHLSLLRAGIAVERYRLKNGVYPEQLEAVVPAYLTSVPLDPFTENPLSYRLQPDGSPLIWSVGADLIDSGGVPNRDSRKGDPIWITQPIPGFTKKDYDR